MRRDAPSLLHDIISALQSIESTVAGHDLDSYLRTENLPESINWRITVAGEAADQLLRLNPEVEVHFPELGRLIAVRHRIVHGYFSVDDRQFGQSQLSIFRACRSASSRISMILPDAIRQREF